MLYCHSLTSHAPLSHSLLPAASAVLVLDGARRVVKTMLGCTETLICEGIASEMEWSKGSDDLSNNTVVSLPSG